MPYHSKRHWDEKDEDDVQYVQFVKTAWKYRTKLDLVVYTNAWDVWSDAEISKAAQSVVDTMGLKMPAGIGGWLKNFVPFTEKTHASMGDGVTVYFADYSNTKKAEKRENIAKFIETLHQLLEKKQPDADLNIMLRVDLKAFAGETGKTGQGIFEPLQTALLAGKDDVQKNYVDLILVLLDEPTTDTKKQLRSAIEGQFKGENRRIIERKIVPIISSAMGEDEKTQGKFEQFKDDLIYFEDNFKGVGLWPLPLTQNPDAKKVNKLLITWFKKEVDDGSTNEDFMARMAANYLPQICNYVCPHRWLFRIAFDVLILLLLLLWVLSYMICGLRKRISDKPWPVIGVVIVTTLIFSASLVCDPYWKQRADEVMIGLVVVAVVYALWRYIRKIGQGRVP
jgi:hypothetical protein